MLLARIRNYVRQRRDPDLKIFFIGFNKCGTTALYHLMKHSGIRSLHWANGTLAERIQAGSEHPEELKAYLAPWTSFSDMILLTNERLIEGNTYFRLLHRLFPHAYFVLNDRDRDAWIRSRLKHSNGTMLSRCMKATGLDEPGIRAMWQENYSDHRAEVLDYFADNPRFLHFRVDEQPTLIDFLAPSFAISERGWRRVNET
jgi:hypothetical protein